MGRPSLYRQPVSGLQRSEVSWRFGHARPHRAGPAGEGCVHQITEGSFCWKEEEKTSRSSEHEASKDIRYQAREARLSLFNFDIITDLIQGEQE